MTDMFKWLYSDIKHYNDKANYSIGANAARTPLTSAEQKKLENFREEMAKNFNTWMEFERAIADEEEKSTYVTG